MNQFFPQIEAEVRRRLATTPACHDWDHTARVLRHARHIASVEKADPTIVAFAAVLHDVGRARELTDQGKTCHATLGARLSQDILRDVGIRDQDFIDRVVHCVRTHRFRSRNGEKPATIEAKVVFDADKLDSLGAVGIGRAFHFAGRVGARLHNTAEEALAASSYSPNDTAYREYLVKLRKVPDRMLTAEGRRLGIERCRFMDTFFERLEHEIVGRDF